jgi:hypothetical protein
LTPFCFSEDSGKRALAHRTVGAPRRRRRSGTEIGLARIICVCCHRRFVHPVESRPKGHCEDQPDIDRSHPNDRGDEPCLLNDHTCECRCDTRSTIGPPRTAGITAPIASAAATMPVLAALPVVWRTNYGPARMVMLFPTCEMAFQPSREYSGIRSFGSRGLDSGVVLFTDPPNPLYLPRFSAANAGRYRSALTRNRSARC